MVFGNQYPARKLQYISPDGKKLDKGSVKAPTAAEILARENARLSAKALWQTQVDLTGLVYDYQREWKPGDFIEGFQINIDEGSDSFLLRGDMGYGLLFSKKGEISGRKFGLNSDYCLALESASSVVGDREVPSSRVYYFADNLGRSLMVGRASDLNENDPRLVIINGERMMRGPMGSSNFDTAHYSLGELEDVIRGHLGKEQ